MVLPKVRKKLAKLPLILQVFGAVVQLVRIQPCQGWGRGFESRPLRQLLKFDNFLKVVKSKFKLDSRFDNFQKVVKSDSRFDNFQKVVKSKFKFRK